MKIADLHCDLLAYLQVDPKRTPYDPVARSSAIQMKEGGVVFQTLAIYTKTRKGSVQCASEQFEIYKTLPTLCPGAFGKGGVEIPVALENASGVCEEEEPFEKGLERLEKMAPLLYISMTWNDENRFGGGNLSTVGLKPDGQRLLEWMNGKNIAIDFSHTSDALAQDTLNFLDKKNLKIRPIASHSNFRKISDVSRNLPDEIAKEIVKRGGVIGLNFVRRFIGSECPKDFVQQIEHAASLGLLDNFCFGADFFDDREIPKELDYLRPTFFEGLDNSSCYPKLLEMLRKNFSDEILEKIAYKNLWRFLGR